MSMFQQILEASLPEITKRIPVRVNVRELSRNTTKVLSELRDQHTGGLITYRGVPQFAIVPLDAEALQATLLDSSPMIFSRSRDHQDLEVITKPTARPDGRT